MLFISIDGACRRNGKPDCASSGGIFIQKLSKRWGSAEFEVDGTAVRTAFEKGSTNQRGELLALLTTLRIVDKSITDHRNIYIVTDSEYILNTMKKEWVSGWKAKGWKTASGNPVKNRDLWEQIDKAYESCVAQDIEIVFYHIKGHVIPFGKVTARNSLLRDPSGAALLKLVYEQYDKMKLNKQDKLEAANELSSRNNGTRLTPDLLRMYVVANTMADAIATKHVDKMDNVQ